jgi:insertion element IS1 protein InsB
MTMVDRDTRCIVSWRVVWERTVAVAQDMVDSRPAAAVYFSDAFPSWEAVLYLQGAHVTLIDKSQTYSVEGDNAELRHYLARLARKSRCFSRCILALQAAMKLFVYAWNARQLHKQRFPNYPAHVKDFAYP